MKPVQRRPQFFILPVLIGLLLYGGFIIRHAAYAAVGVDGSGYVNSAQSLWRGSLVKPVRALDQFDLPESYIELFAPVAYLTRLPSRTMVPLYPIGVPSHMVAAILIFGEKYGPFLVSPILAVLSLIMIYLLGRDLGLEREYAAAGALLFIPNPTFNHIAVQPVSDVVAMFWALVTIYAALRSDRRPIWGLAAGAAFGVAFLVRPVSILLLIPLIFALRFSRKNLLLFILGGIPLAIIFFSYNAYLFGNPLDTGYALIGHKDQITFSGFADRFGLYLYWLTMTMSPLPLCGWIGLGFLPAVEWRRKALLISWFAAFLLFFASYNYFDKWWCTRFLLPAYPALIIGALLTSQHLLAKYFGEKANLRRVAAGALLLVSLGFAYHYLHKFEITKFGPRVAFFGESCRWAESQMPPRTMILSESMSGTLFYYTDRSLVRWNNLMPSQWETLRRRGLERGYQFYALLLPDEVEQARQRAPGNWIEVGELNYISLWRIQ